MLRAAVLLLLLGAAAAAATAAEGGQDGPSALWPPSYAQQRSHPLHRVRGNPARVGGEIMQMMEWLPGTNDENDGPRVFTTAPGARARPRVVSPSATVEVPHAVTPQQQDAQTLAAAIVRAYSKVNDPTEQAASPLIKEYLRFLDHNKWYNQRMREIFAKLDVNGDGNLDDQELQDAVRKEYLT